MSEQDVEKPAMPPEADSPPWDRTIKIFVAVTTVILIAAFATRFQNLILQIAAAAIIAYVVSPIIDGLIERTSLSRTAALLLVYFVVALALVVAFAAFGTTIFTQALNLIQILPELISRGVEWLSTTTDLHLGPYAVDVAAIWRALDQDVIEEQLLASIGTVVNRTGRTIFQLLGSTLQLGAMLFFTIIISIYLAYEMPNLGGYVERAARQPGYSYDAGRLTRDFGRIWRAYLRGQVALGLVIGAAVWITLTLLGVQNAFALGMLSGLLEFLPVIGPFIGTAAAAITALFQTGNPFGLDPLLYALLVIGIMIIIQQIENNILVPRIVGVALDLHPLIVIVGVVVASSIAGLIGAILAAPILATVKLLGTYAWRKMFDLPPFSGPEPEERPRGPTLSERANAWRKRLIRTK